MKNKEIIKNIQVITQFKNLGSAELEAIALVCTKEIYKKDEILFSENDKADSVYLLIEGKVEIWKDFNTLKRDLLAMQEKGHIVGEMAVIDELRRSATVLASEDIKTYSISNTDFINLLQRLPELSFEFMKSISMLVRMSNENFVNELRNKNIRLEKTNKKILTIQNELVKKERLSTVGQFASMILHDIRNPISVIKGYADILQIKNSDSVKVKNYAKAIHNEALALNSLASEMLDFSKGEIKLNLSIVELDKLVDAIFENISKKNNHREILFKKKVEFTGPVLLDYERIFRVLINLCDNSLKALYNGGIILIHISAKKNHYEIKVSDDGDGIEDDLLDRIFEPFATFSKAGGTGLGMVIVKNIIEAHYGSVKIESEKHLGTTVTISLPFKS